MKSEQDNRKKIAVLFGGCSSEYEVSLQSASAVIANMDIKKFEPILIGIDKKGSWFLFEGNKESILKNKWRREEKCYPMTISTDKSVHGFLVWGKEEKKEPQIISVEAAFPVLHGKNGEDGTVQGMLELAGIPVIGCNTLSSAICMDKDVAHRLVETSGVKVPRSILLWKETDENPEKLANTLGYPLFVKPLRAGSSFGITKVTDQKHLKDALELAFTYDDTVVMEEMIEGFEVGCAILGTRQLTVGEVDEIELADGFFDFTEKYTLKTSKIHVPARITAKKAKEIKETAIKIYRSLNCSCFARVDMFLTPDGSIYFNEVNTIPGFTEHSRYPQMMRAAGISFQNIISRLIGQVVEKQE